MRIISKATACAAFGKRVRRTASYGRGSADYGRPQNGDGLRHSCCGARFLSCTSVCYADIARQVAFDSGS